MPDGKAWDFNSWLRSVFADPLFWQVIHAALFPFGS